MRKTNAEYQKGYVERYPDRIKVSARKRYRKKREYILKAKDVPCMDCGKRYPSFVMDFDHRDRATKICQVPESRSYSKLIEEIAKCDIVCANCHRYRTHSNEELK